MKNDFSTIYCIEHLTLGSWVIDFFPYFFGNKQEKVNISKIYYVDATGPGLFLARLALKRVGIKIEELKFRRLNVRDRNGDSIWYKVMFKDAFKFQDDILRNPDFQKALTNYEKERNLSLFLLKESMCDHLTDQDVLLRFLFLIRVISWKADQEERKTERLVLFMQNKPWGSELRQYALNENIELRFVKKRGLNVRRILLRSNRLKSWVKQALYYWMTLKYAFTGKMVSENVNNQENEANNLKSLPKIGVEYYGQLNLNNPEKFSDLFFYQMSNLSTQDIVLYFNLSNDPITDEKLTEIKKHGLSAIALHSRATKTPNVPIFKHSKEKRKFEWSEKTANKNAVDTHKWLRKKLFDYNAQYSFWIDFFTQNNIKTHVTWYKQGSDHCVKADALRNLGGISVVYQRSYEDFPEPWTTARADVVFGFSSMGAHAGQENQSRIPYYVTTGYLGDHRFDLLRHKSQDIRNSLRKHGAKKILAFFDENAAADQRWCAGHDIPQKNYGYFLNKVLDNPWFGLILKPKFPGTLRKRLGPEVSKLLDRAKETGRCYIFEGSEILGIYPPAAAAVNADMAVHGYLSAATAAVEAALSGTPTLMLDYEGWSKATLNKLGEGKVIFKDLDNLWDACLGHWSDQKGESQIGDWSGMLDSIDPFRDGRAAERMGTYLEWIQEGFKANLSKETILADAAQRYTKVWGKDKIFAVNCNQTSLVAV